MPSVSSSTSSLPETIFEWSLDTPRQTQRAHWRWRSNSQNQKRDGCRWCRRLKGDMKIRGLCDAMKESKRGKGATWKDGDKRNWGNFIITKSPTDVAKSSRVLAPQNHDVATTHPPPPPQHLGYLSTTDLSLWEREIRRGPQSQEWSRESFLPNGEAQLTRPENDDEDDDDGGGDGDDVNKLKKRFRIRRKLWCRK